MVESFLRSREGQSVSIPRHVPEPQLTLHPHWSFCCQSVSKKSFDIPEITQSFQVAEMHPRFPMLSNLRTLSLKPVSARLDTFRNTSCQFCLLSFSSGPLDFSFCCCSKYFQLTVLWNSSSSSFLIFGSVFPAQDRGHN